MRTRRLLEGLAVSLFFGGAICWAQVTTATISGSITDATGAVIPGATVKGTNMETGISRTAEADTKGQYHLPQLPVGTYDVKVEAAGFQAAVQTAIKLTVGQEATLNFSLHVGAVAEAITITGDVPVVETTTSSLSALVDDQQIRALPLNGRDFTELLTLEVGTSQEIQKTGGNIATGTGKRITVSGARTSFNEYLVDGTEVADLTRQAPGSVSGQQLGVDAIQEYSVLTTSYGASYPSQGGAVVNAVSRAGTNKIHGTLFEFLRNSALDSNEWANNRIGAPKAPFKRNQFGFSLGGPIRKDKTFYFGNLELLRDRLGTSNTDTVPDANTLNGLLPILDANKQVTGYKQVNINPLIKPFLALYPPINTGKITPSTGTGEFFNSYSQPTNDYYWMARVDHHFSDSDSVFARYTFDKSQRSAPDGGGLGQLTTIIKWQYATVNYSHIFSPTWINTVLLGYARALGHEDDSPTFPDLGPAFAFTPGIRFGLSSAITLDGGALTALGAAHTDEPKDYQPNHYQMGDNVTTTHGPHQLKFGVRVMRYADNFTPAANGGGSYNFASIAALLAGTPKTFSGAVPGVSIARTMTQWLPGVYIDDSYQVRPRLTLNLGLRYEQETVPTEKYNRLWGFRSALDATPTQGAPFNSMSGWENFQPRVGFAWDVRGNGKTAVRAGFGLYRQYLLSQEWFIQTVRQPPLYTLVQANNPPFLGVYRTVNPNNLLPSLGSTNDYYVKPPYVLQYNFAIQQQITTGTSLTVAYVGSHGNHLAQVVTSDVEQPTILPNGQECYNYPGGNPYCPHGSLTLLNPNLAGDSRTMFVAKSFYNSLQVNYNWRLHRGLQAGVSYTYSKDIDSGAEKWDFANGGTTTAASTQTPFNLNNSRGLSPIDQRHSLAINAGYEFPKIGWGNNIAKSILDGWQTNGVFRRNSGKPSTPVLGYNLIQNGLPSSTTRPNLAPGASNNPVLGGPNQYFNPNAFQLQPPGFIGNTGANTVIGPGYVGLDFSLVRAFPVGEGRRLNFRMEFFNLLNHPNYVHPNMTIQTSATAPFPNPLAGQILDTVAPARQIQFALKFEF